MSRPTIADGRSGIGAGLPPGSAPLHGSGEAGLALQVPGQPVGTIGAVILGDTIESAGRISEAGGVLGVTPEQREALLTVPTDGNPHSVDMPGLGNYRAIVSEHGPDGLSFIVALPLASVKATSASSR